MSIRLNGKIIADAGGGAGQSGATPVDEQTIITNENNSITTIGVKPKQGETMYDWVGTLTEYERGRNNKTIPDNWVCWITDDAEFGPTISQEQVDSFLTKNQITNCITEIPQRIKFELTDGIVTLKAGSQVIVPNGFEEDGITPKFDYIITEEDLTHTRQTGASRDWLLFHVFNNSKGKYQVSSYQLSSIHSGETAPSTEQYMIWYDTKTNKVKTTSDTGVTWLENASLPLAAVASNSIGITSINNIFNGMGYIGPTVWVDKGVKALIPNGRNEDGTLRNIEFTTSKIYFETTNSTAKNMIGVIDYYGEVWDGHRFVESETQPNDNSTYTFWYQPSTNLIKWHTTETSGWNIAKVAVFARYIRTSGKVSEFKLKYTFQTLDYNNKAQIGAWGLPSNKYIDLTLGASGTTYTAPANGWIQFKKEQSNTSTYMQIENITTGFGDQRNSAGVGSSAYISMPIAKGNEFKVLYDLAGTTNRFRFYYAEGEV